MYSDQHCYDKNISTEDLVLNFCSQGKEISTKLNIGFTGLKSKQISIVFDL